MTLQRAGTLAYYYILNGLFGACTYYGFYEGVEGAKNVSVFIGWLVGIISIIYVIGLNIPDVRKQIAKMLYEKNWKPSAPYIVDATFDLCILATFIWFGHYFLSVFYIMNMIGSKGLRDVSKEMTFDILTGRAK